MRNFRIRRPRLALPAATLLLSVLFLVLPAITARAAVDIQEVRSDKGVTAWLVEEHAIPLIAMSFSFEGGSAADPADKPGIAHFTGRGLDIDEAVVVGTGEKVTGIA